MGLVNITLLEQGQNGVDADDLNALVTPLQTEINGKIDNNNISANAAIACSKTNGSFGSVNISTSSGNITTSTGTLTVGGASTLSGTLAVTGAQTNAAGLKLTESTAPSTAANVGALYTKNDGTQTELYFREESDGDEIQVTKGGEVNSSLKQATGTISIASTGNVSATGLGFQPSVVIFLFGYASASHGGSAGVGIMTSSKQYSQESHSDNADHGSGTSTSAIVLRNGNGSPVIGQFDYVSMDTDGFTINISNAESGYNVMWIALA